jgi:methylase of polypeptide subunit release factors
VVLSLIQITPSFHLNSQLTLFFMTDFSHHSSYSSPSSDSSSFPETYFEPVMYIGPDSLALFQSMSPPNTNPDGTQSFFPSTPSRALDVFCGCGIQGITALKINLVNKVTFVEKNHRAVRFLRFNLLLNGVPLERAEVIHDNVQNIHSHLSSPSSSPPSLLSQQTQFQLILANPPYIPTGLLSKKASQETSERGLLGYGAGGADGEEFIAFVYTDLIRYLALPLVSSGCAVGGASGVYLVSNLVNVHQYPAKLSQWITHSSQVSGNTEFLNQVTEHKLLFSGFISHDKPWTPHQYAQLILDRSSSASEVNPKVDQYAQDLTEIGIESVCNGLVFLKLHAAPVPAATTAVSIVETHVEECPEQVWQLLNLPETLKERYLEIQQKISQYRI